ncbi:MAG: TldD/PmbA family protein [Candidatus Latescibacteria bacterium]|nr:TldD/PmbA family protein [Candidatus Latescibacterota bacterium]
MIELGELAIKKALELGADQAEAFLVKGKSFYVSFEANDIKLAKSQISDGIGIRVFKNKGLGFSSVNTLSQEKVIDTVSNAVRLANLAPADNANSLPKTSGEIPEIKDLYDPQVENLSMEQVLDYASKLLKTAINYDQRILIDSGVFAGSYGENVIVNSQGIKVSERGSSFDYGIMGMAEDKGEVSCFQYEFDNTRKLSEINVLNTAVNFAEKVLKSLGAKKGESFQGPVILEPEVLGDFLSIVIGAVSANNIQKKMSRFIGQLNQKVVSQDLTIEDNALLPGGAASSGFDREGVARKPLKIIENGILKAYLYNTYTANKENRESTGHAAGGARSIPGVGPTNILINAGEKSQADLVKETKKGLFVTRLSVQPDPFSGDFSGVVKGGFLIEDGVFKRPVIETMITGNIFALLNQISGLSQERKKVGSFLIPYCRIEDVSITSG